MRRMFMKCPFQLTVTLHPVFVNPAEELGMEDGDCLDVVMEQVGGHRAL